MSKVIKIKKGLNIRLKGKAEKIFIKADLAGSYALKPTDFVNITPKLIAKPGDKVKAGSPVFFNKSHEDVIFTSPVSGTVKDVVRGARRKILEITIEPGKEMEFEKFETGDPLNMTREQVISNILISGIWPYIRQRPYSTVADPRDMPKAIFIPAFNTAPLAPDPDYLVKDRDKEFQVGINALSKLTGGKIHVNVDGRYPVSSVYAGTKGIQINKFVGPHPTGNVGVQVHHLDPLNKGEKIWYLKPQDVMIIGKLFLEGVYDASKVIAITGSEVLKPRYYKIINGASVANLLEKNLQDDNVRVISGDVLTGNKIRKDGYIGYYDNQITVIPEGDYHEFMGWARPGFTKFSTSRSFWSWLAAGKQYRLDTNLHGGERAFVMSGQYEKVMPLDIYPVHLLKAILVEDIDLMERLGIYEVDPEDFALCDFVCTSKINTQEIIRDGLDLMLKEMS